MSTLSANDVLNAASRFDTNATSRQVIFIENTLNNWQDLAALLPSSAEVVVLDGSKDGLAQIAAYLAEVQTPLDAIHILSHGAPGQIELGTASLTTDSLAQYTQQLEQIGKALTDEGDLLLYGCDVASGSDGEWLVQHIAAITQADVAASTDLTGHSSLGGDWVLETRSGAIASAELMLAEYMGTLAVTVNSSFITGLDSPTDFTVDSQNNVYTASFSNDTVHKISAGNFTTGGDVSTIGSSFATITSPTAIAIDSAGNLYIGVSNTSPITKYSNSGGVPGNSGATLGSHNFNTVADIIAASDGFLYVADSGDGKVYKISASDGSISDFATVSAPQQMYLDASNNLYVVSSDTGTVIKFTASSGNISLVSPSNFITGVPAPATTITSDGTNFYIGSGDFGDGELYKFSSSGGNVSSATLEYTSTGNAITELLFGGSNTLYATMVNGNIEKITIINAPTVTLGVSPSSVAEAAGTSTITATLSAAAATDTTVTIGRKSSSTATLTSDFTLSSTTITISAGQTTGTATLTAVQDTLDEVDETAIIEITNVTGGDGATESGTQESTVTITDDDAEPSLSISNVSLAEGNSGSSSMTFTVTLSAASGKAVSVDYATSNGTATSGSDYTAASGTLNFAAGDTSKTFTVTIAGDTTTETDETFTVTLSNASNATIGTATATGTITNDENAAPTLSAPGTVTTYTDTSAADSFTSYTGTLSGSDPESDTLTYGIASPTSSSANYTAGSITYDISKTGSYGTLYVKSTTGQYIYVPTGSAIDAVASGSSPTDNFSVTVTDASHTGSPTAQTLTVAITGGNDAPTAIALSSTEASTYDSNNAAVGTLTRTDVDGGGPTYSIVSVDGVTSGGAHNYFTISGTTLQIADPGNTPVGSYAVVVRVNDGTSNYDQSFNLSVSNTLVVDTTTDDTYGSGTGTYTEEKTDGTGLSLREAVALANNKAGGGTISFASGLGALTLGTSVTLSENITLDADVVNTLSIAGNMVTTSGKTLTLSNAAGDALTLSGDISGGGNLVKTGVGTLTLSGSNSFSGTLMLSGGTLSTDSLNNASSLTLDGGTLQARTSSGLNSALGVSITSNGGGLDVTNGNVTLSGALTGTGPLSVTGAGGKVVALSGNNSGYSGAITLDTSIIQVGSNTALGTGALTWNSGKIRAGGSGYSVDNAITLGGNVTVSGSNALTFNGSVNFGNASRTISTDVDTTFSGALSNSSGVFTKAGTGTMTLTNTGNSGTLASGITVTAGTLSVASDNQLSSGTLTLNGGNLAVTGATTIDNAIVLSQAATLTNTGNLTLSGVLSGSGAFTKTGAGTLGISGNSNTLTGAITLSAGALVIATDANLGTSNSATITLASGTNFDITSSTTVDNAITLSGSASLSVNNSAVVTLSGALSGAGTTLTKGGLGTLILSNTSNSAATTTALTVNGGVLSVDTSSTMVGGTLTLNGGNLTITSTGDTFANAIVLSSAATLTNANATTLSGDITGSAALTKAGAGTLTLSSTNNSNAAATLTVTAGTVSVSSDSQLVGGSLTLNGGTLNLNNAGTVDNAIVLDSGNGTISVTNGAATLSGVISGAGSLTKTGGQLLTLSGNNTYTGGTTVRGAAGLSITDGSNIGSGTLTLEADLTITSGTTTTISNAIALSAAATISNANAVALSGVLSGSGDLTKAGAGTLTLSGTNTHSGAVTVSAGGLRVEGGSSIGDSSAVTVASGATLTLNGGSETIGSLAGAGSVTLGYGLTLGGDNTSTIFSGVISGTGNGINKTGTGTLTLSGANTYTGSTTVSAGELVLFTGDNLQDNTAVTVNSGATLTLNGGNETIGSLAGAGSVVLDSNTLTTGGSNTSTSYSGVMSGTGGLTKTGSGTLTLSGANTYTGATTVSAGTLTLQGGSSISDSSAVTLSAGTTLTLSDTSETIGSLAGAGDLTLNSYTLTAGADNTSTSYSGVMSGTGGLTKVGSGTLTLSGANSYTGATTISAGGLTLSTGNNLSDSSAVTVASGATLTLGGNETIASLAGAGSVALGSNTLTLGDSTSTTYSGVMSGGGALSKSGTGTLTLSGSNTYTGATTLSAGTLVVDGALASSAVSVANAAKLSGIGSISGAVTLSSGGSIEAGVSLGTLTLSNGLTLSSGSTLAAEVKGTAAGTGYDQISVVGAVDITGATLSIDLGSFTPATGNTFTLIDNDGSDAVVGTFNGLAEGATVSVGGYMLSLSYVGGDGNDVVLAMATPTVSAVSAPSTATYIAGQNLDFTVTLSESVTLDTTGGTPRLILNIGGTTKYASYLSGSGTTQLVFRYTLESGLTDTDGITVSSLDANGGTLQGSTGIDADLTLNGIASMAGVKVDSVAPNAPSITGISTDTGSSSSDGYTSDTTLVISGTTEVNATVTVFKGGTLLGTSIANGSGAWSYDYTGTTLTAGNHNFTATAADVAGNTSLASSTYAVIVDTTAPTDVTLGTPSATPSSAIANAAISTLSSTDVSVGDSFTYQLISGVGDTDNASFAISGNTLKVGSTALATGSYSVRVQSTDKAGNTFEKILTFVVTPEAPAPLPNSGLPPTSEWPSLSDNDGDGIPEQVESLVPSLAGGVSGDGNGDGIADTEQTNVASIPFRDTEQVTQNPDAPVVFVTLVGGSTNGIPNTGSTVNISSAQQLDAPADKPANIDMPLGLISFTANASQEGATETFSLFVDGNVAVNGYWKQDNSGQWVNLASAAFGGQLVTDGEKVRLDFQIQDGGEFDSDGLADGVITDPGAIGFNTDSVNHAPTLNIPPATRTNLAAKQPVALPDFTVADVDGDDLVLTLTTTNGTLGNLTDVDAISPGIQLSGSASQINTALTHAVFTPASSAAANVYFSLTDGIETTTGVYSLTDNIAPSVIAYSPADGAQGVAANSNITLTFSESIARGTGAIQLRAGSPTGTIVETFNAANSSRLSLSANQLTIDPTYSLAANTQYFVTVATGSIKDLAGNRYLGTTTYDFSTVADNTAPVVTAYSPPDGTRGVALDANVLFTFSEVITRGMGSIQLRAGSPTGTVVETFDAASSARLGLLTNQLSIDPTQNLTANTRYFVTFANGAIKDLAGNPYAGTTAYDFFTTTDGTAPVVTAYSPADGAQGVTLDSNIVFTFSEAITRGTGYLQLRSGSLTGAIVETFAVNSPHINISGNQLSLDPTRNLLADTQYFVTFSNGAVKDLAGNRYAGTTTYDFSTNLDTTAPVVTAYSPPDGTQNVALDSNFLFTFSEAIARGTGYIQLRVGSPTGAIVEIFSANNPYVSISGNQLTLDPTHSLTASTQYFITFASGAVKDLAGNYYAGTSTYDFFTVADTTAPIVTAYSPPDGTLGISVDSNILFTFSEAIAQGTGSIQLRLGSVTGAIVESFDAATSSRLSISANQLTIDPTLQLATNTRYFVTFAEGSVQDKAGNLYAGTNTYHFTTTTPRSIEASLPLETSAVTAINVVGISSEQGDISASALL